MSKKMRVVQVPQAGGPLELVERDIPEPERGWVRVKVEACGVCHSDSLVKEGLWPGIQYPRVPGHEVIGVVDDVGEGVKPRKTGQRVGVGWHAGNCGYCDHCRRGEFFACTVALLTTGISFDGGYAEYMVAPAEAVAFVPDELSAVGGRDDVQRAQKQRRKRRRCRCGARDWRTRSPWRAVRSQDGIQNGGDRARERQSGIRETTRCTSLHRQPRIRSCG